MEQEDVIALSTSGFQEESLDSDEDVAVTNHPDNDTDTDGEEMTIEEATRNLATLVKEQQHSEEFYNLLLVTLTATPIQYLEVDHPVVILCTRLVSHVVRGIESKEHRTKACLPFSLLIRNRACVRELMRSDLGILIKSIAEVDDSEGHRAVLMASIRILSASRLCRQEILRCGGVQMMLEVLVDQASQEESKASAVCALRRLCKTTSSRELIAKLYGVNQLLEFFFQFPSQPVQKSLAGLLQTLATNADVKIQLAEMGSIPKFVALLTLSQVHMLKYVICIVRNVSCNNDQNRMIVANAGGIKMLLDLIPHVSVKLQQKIAGALQNLATNRENRAEISKYGGLRVLIALIQTKDQKLQKYGLGGLKRLVYNSRESTLDFQKQGGLAPLIELLDSEDVNVLKNAVHAVNRVWYYIGREPIEQLGGVAATARLLACPYEKIRVLARRNLLAMNEDVVMWIKRIEQCAVEILVAARVLLNTHWMLALPSTKKNTTNDNNSNNAGNNNSNNIESNPPLGRPKLRRGLSLRKTLRSSKEAIAPLSPSLSASTSQLLTTPKVEEIFPTEALFRSLGFGETYWNLRPGTPHILPIPVLQLILGELDVHHVLTKRQLTAIFSYSRDRSTFGKPVQDFLTQITNNPCASTDPLLAENQSKAGCSLM